MLKINKVAVLISLGSALEYYDFIIYAFLAQYIGQLFFPAGDRFVSIIAAFSVFAIGYFIRPLGGLIFGVFGDKYGRKKVFLFSILLMAFSTFLMGLTPSYYSAGAFATVLFVIFRLLQGLSFGAELPGATTIITEHSTVDRRGFNCAIMVSFVTFGVLMGSFVVFIITTLFSSEFILRIGWRFPFILGGVLALIAYIIRIGTGESPYFEKFEKRKKNPLSKLFLKHPRKLLVGCGAILLPSSLVMFVLVMPTYFSEAYHFTEKDVYLAISIGYGWSILTVLIFGYLSDYIKRKLFYLTTITGFIVTVFAVFRLLPAGSFFHLQLFIIIYQTFISLMTVCFYPMLSENFPTEIRYTGIAVCYNVIYALTSLIPVLVNYFYKLLSSRTIVILLFIVIAVISLLFSIFLKDYTGQRMED